MLPRAMSLLTKVLREEWGFEGFVVSDWGAVNERVKALAAGLGGNAVKCWNRRRQDCSGCEER